MLLHSDSGHCSDSWKVSLLLQTLCLPAQDRQGWRLGLAEASGWGRLAVVKATAAAAHTGGVLEVALTATRAVGI